MRAILFVLHLEKSKLLASETREFEKDAKEARDTVRSLFH